LLCKNETGYHNLCYLVSSGFTEGFYIKPRIDWQLLSEHSEGLVCLSGCVAGEIQQRIINGDYSGAKNRALELREVFGEDGFYLEMQAHGIPEERIAAEGLVKLHRETGIPLVLTNDAIIRKKRRPLSGCSHVIQMGKTVDDPDRIVLRGTASTSKRKEIAPLFRSTQSGEALTTPCEDCDACNFRFDSSLSSAEFSSAGARQTVTNI
jgi:DNA polymerase-3 subunit alpha